MNTDERDPIFESLDRLAGIADTDVVGDRMPDIQRRVRVSRQRKGAGIVAAAAVVAIAGVAVWQGLPSEQSAPPPVTPPKPWQDITMTAEPQTPFKVRVTYTITGESTAYADGQTGKPTDYAGPIYTQVLVDGEKTPVGTDGGDIVCDPDGELTAYSMEFGVDAPMVVTLPLAGEHTITVEAPYCADGSIVESSQSLVVTTEATGFTTGDQLKTDLDGDGSKEDVRIRVPNDVNAWQELQVTWGTGETTSTPLENTMEYGLFDPVDLDGDGNRELILNGGGGETSIWFVYLATPEGLEQVKTVDAEGKDLPLSSPGEAPKEWHISYGPDGIRSYKLVDPNAATPPAPVEVREWTLSGDTLTQSAESTNECVLSYNPTLELGPC